MEMECDLMVDCINGSLLFESKWEEKFEQHVGICRECQKFMELMSELPYLVNARTFSSGMKERILTLVFEEKPDSYAMMFF